MSPEGREKIRAANFRRFIKDARLQFGDRFTYDQVRYVRQKIPVEIVCPDHGPFWQTPDKHLQSATGCPKCATARISKAKRDAGRARFTREFLHKFRGQISLCSQYVTGKEPITCFCERHRIQFRSVPDRLLRAKHACPKCAIEARGKASRLQPDAFVQRVQEKFGGHIAVSAGSFNGIDEPILAVCSRHGEFPTTPRSLLYRSAHGCPICSRARVGYVGHRLERLETEKTEPRKAARIALMRVEIFGLSAIKLGVTNRSLETRYKEALKEVYFEARLHELNALKLEQHLHAKYHTYQDKRIFCAGMRSGERWAGDTELYVRKALPLLLDELKTHIAGLEKKDPQYWERVPKLQRPVAVPRAVDRPKGEFNRARPIICLNDQKVFPSLNAAAKALGEISGGNIWEVCRGKRGHVKGMRFAYLDEYRDGKVPLFIPRNSDHHPSARPVVCVDTGEQFRTASAAAREKGTGSGHIVSVCRGRRHVAGGFRWAYLQRKE